MNSAENTTRCQEGPYHHDHVHEDLHHEAHRPSLHRPFPTTTASTWCPWPQRPSASSPDLPWWWEVPHWSQWAEPQEEPQEVILQAEQVRRCGSFGRTASLLGGCPAGIWPSVLRVPPPRPSDLRLGGVTKSCPVVVPRPLPNRPLAPSKGAASGPTGPQIIVAGNRQVLWPSAAECDFIAKPLGPPGIYQIIGPSWGRPRPFHGGIRRRKNGLGS